jgi:coiled-coil domain-containing protein 63/114
MSKYVKQLTKEIEGIDSKIKNVKEKIDYYNTQGATYDTEKRKKKIDLK